MSDMDNQHCIAFNLNRLATARKRGELESARLVSIRPAKKRQHTLGHVRDSIMGDVSPVVTASAIPRIRRTGRREVCAWLRGDIIATSSFESFKDREFDFTPSEGGVIDTTGSEAYPLVFNPHTDETFCVIVDGKRVPFKHAKFVVISGTSATASGITF